MAGIKLIYVTASFPYTRGCEMFFEPEIRELAECGYDLVIVPRDTWDRQLEREASAAILSATRSAPFFGGEVIVFAALEFLRTPRKVLGLLSLLLARSGAHRARNLAVFAKSLWLGRLARQIGAGHIHAQWASTTATMAMIASKISGVPWSFTAHRGDIVRNNLLGDKVSSAAFARFISHSGIELASRFAKSGLSAKQRVIRLGVRLQNQSPPASLASRTICCPAALIEVKGHRYLLQAMRILAERGIACRLLMVGEGPLRSELESLVTKLGISTAVEFLGQVPHPAVLDLYRSGSVRAVVLPSLELPGGLQEGIPVALLEAMAFGIPVVTTATGGVPELLGSGGGFMLPPRNAEAIADALEKLLTDPALCGELGAMGRAMIAREFDARATARQLADAIDAAHFQIPGRQGGVYA